MMSKNTDLKDIFEAMEEINLLSERRKKNKEILILDKNQEIISKEKVIEEEKIPLTTEYKINKIIDQYLNNRKCIEKLFLLIDSKHGFKEKDQEIIKELDILFKEKVFIIFTKKDRLRNSNDKENLYKYNEKASNEFNKKFFNTSIKEVNTIILLKKFMMNPLMKNYENIK